MGNHKETITQEGLINDRLQEVFELIEGTKIQDTITEIARQTGELVPTGTQETYYAVNRLAYSPNEFVTRSYLSNCMGEIGIEIQDHPLGIIGSYKGQDNSLMPLIIMSHFDSVPQGGMYDGVTGLAAAIHVLKVFNNLNINTRRPITLLALTGEESSRFNIALFGSRGIFHGLTEEELSSKRPGDISMQEAMENSGYSAAEVTNPLFTKNNTYATLELHVDQTGMLEAQEKDFGIVQAIAAPDRREIVIEPEQTNLPINRGTSSHVLLIEVNGKSGHSGAVPMGKDYRADGLVVSAELLSHIHVLNNKIARINSDTSVLIESVSILDQSLNKIPGKVGFTAKIYGNDQRVIEYILTDLQNFTERRNNYLEQEMYGFGKDAIALNVKGVSTDIQETELPSPNFNLLARIAMTVHSICNLAQYRNFNIVGTIGTCSQKPNGQLVLGLDVRGIDADLRNEAIEHILHNIATISDKLNAQYAVRQLPGSGFPVQLSASNASKIEDTIINHKLGNYIKTHSPAGHDTLNAANAGIPASLLFIPSGNGGEAHTPLEYTSPDSLKKGADALAAIVYRLGNEL